MSKEKSGNWFARHKVLTVILVVIAIGVISVVASSSNDEPTVVDRNDTSAPDDASNGMPEKTTFTVDEVIAFDNKEVTVTGVERNWNSGNQFITPDSGKEYVKVGVAIKNNSSSQISYNTFDWKMKDSTGDIQGPDSVVFTIDGALSSGELAEGGTKTGFLVFEVPSGDTGLVLQYEPGFWLDKKLEVNL